MLRWMLALVLISSPVFAADAADDMRLALGLIPDVQLAREAGNQLREALLKDTVVQTAVCYRIGRFEGNAESLALELMRYPTYAAMGETLKAQAASLDGVCETELTDSKEREVGETLIKMAATMDTIKARIAADETRRNEVKDKYEDQKQAAISFFEKRKSEVEAALDKAKQELEKGKAEANKAMQKAGIRGLKF